MTSLFLLYQIYYKFLYSNFLQEREFAFMIE